MFAMSFGLIMFICIVPSSILMFFQCYPGDWKKRNLILGVKNREEYRTGETLEVVDKIYAKYRGAGLKIVIATCVISCLLLFLKGMTLATTVWTTFIMVALIAEMIPLSLGNKEMKDLKRRLGLSGETNVTYVDLSNAGAIRTLKMPQVVAPHIVSLLVFLVALLSDLKVIPMEHGWTAGYFIGTGVALMFWLVGAIITAVGYAMDRSKNEVISRDSTVNANYNRAKKKNMSNYVVMFLWTNAIFTAISIASFSVAYSEVLFMASIAIYMLLIMGGMVLYVLRERKVEEHYAKESKVFEDDDDHWILGSIYYNPKDKRLNVEKHVGVGGTVNFAHPIGKLIGVLGALSIVATFVAIIMIGMMESTPMKLQIEDGKVICHHLYDEYVIDMDDIEEVKYLDGTGMRMSRVSGVGMDTLLKGNFVVDGQGGCKVFLWRENQYIIMIKTSGRTYYVNSSSVEDTMEIYQEIQKNLD